MKKSHSSNVIFDHSSTSVVLRKTLSVPLEPSYSIDKHIHYCALINMDGHIVMGSMNDLLINCKFYLLNESKECKIWLGAPVCSPKHEIRNKTCHNLTGHEGYGILRLYRQHPVTKKVIKMTFADAKSIITEYKDSICGSAINISDIDTLYDDDYTTY